jgi:geranylgeranyl diphosphate synthase type I
VTTHPANITLTATHTDTTDAPDAAALPPMFERYRNDLADALKAGLSKDAASSSPQGSPAEPPKQLDVYGMLRYGMGWADTGGHEATATTGKALRPTLCLFACEATGGDPARAMPAAVALEYIHNFSLIHDDIQDRDETRHHRATIWAVWGVPKAIMAGNVMRTVADVSLSDLTGLGLSPDEIVKLTGTLTCAYLEMIEGQFLDVSYESRGDISLPEYLDMIARKTGALIRCSLELGAYVGSRDATTVEAFRRCGRALGTVFQVKDDVLGVWGDPGSTGKPVGADVRRKKNSFPVVHAMANATGPDAAMLQEVYSKDEPDDQDVEAVLGVMERAGTRRFAEDLAARHSKQALDALAPVELEPGARHQIEELAHFLLVRDH